MADDSAIRRFMEAFNWFTGWSRGLPLEQQPTDETWMEQIRELQAATLALVHVPGCLCKFGLGGNALFDVACEMLREKLRGGE